MKILVTGAAGAIGSHLVERLLAEGHQVTGLDSFDSYYSPAIKRLNAADLILAGGKMVDADLTTAELNNLVRSSEIIFHFAAQPGISAATTFDSFLRNNVIATHRLLEASRQAPKLKMFFHISTSSVYGRFANGSEASETKPTSYYGVTKLAAEQLALAYHREHRLPVAVLRLFSVYGERERPEKFYHRLIRAILDGQTVPFYKGSERHVRSYTYVGDIVDGCLLALSHLPAVQGEIFNLGNNHPATTGEGLKIVEKIIGKKAKLKMLPPRIGDQQETAANISKARKILGYKPKIDLATGLEAQVKWYRDKIYGKIKL